MTMFIVPQMMKLSLQIQKWRYFPPEFKGGCINIHQFPSYFFVLPQYLRLTVNKIYVKLYLLQTDWKLICYGPIFIVHTFMDIVFIFFNVIMRNIYKYLPKIKMLEQDLELRSFSIQQNDANWRYGFVIKYLCSQNILLLNQSYSPKTKTD